MESLNNDYVVHYNYSVCQLISNAVKPPIVDPPRRDT